MYSRRTKIESINDIEREMERLNEEEIFALTHFGEEHCNLLFGVSKSKQDDISKIRRGAVAASRNRGEHHKAFDEFTLTENFIDLLKRIRTNKTLDYVTNENAIRARTFFDLICSEHLDKSLKFFTFNTFRYDRKKLLAEITTHLLLNCEEDIKNELLMKAVFSAFSNSCKEILNKNELLIKNDSASNKKIYLSILTEQLNQLQFIKNRPFDIKNFESVLLRMDDLFGLDIKRRAEFVTKSRKLYSQSINRSKPATSQKNFVLDAAVLRALKKLSTHYQLPEKRIVSALLLSEAREPFHLENLRRLDENIDSLARLQTIEEENNISETPHDEDAINSSESLETAKPLSKKDTTNVVKRKRVTRKNKKSKRK